MNAEFDQLDLRLLDELQSDAGLANNELAERVGLSPSACLRRVRRLRESGVIDRIVAIVDPREVGRPLNVFVEIGLERQADDVLDAFERAVRSVPEIMSCHLMAGEYDYLVHLSVASTADYERIHRQHLSALPAVARLRSNFAIRSVYVSTKFELGDRPGRELPEAS
jgi:Lrp/AsnC family leucine-responsive transcriptional regulator